MVVYIAAHQRGVDPGVSPRVRLHAVSTLGRQTRGYRNVLGAIYRCKADMTGVRSGLMSDKTAA